MSMNKRNIREIVGFESLIMQAMTKGLDGSDTVEQQVKDFLDSQNAGGYIHRINLQINSPLPSEEDILF